jgi:hypothetical protein
MIALSWLLLLAGFVFFSTLDKDGRQDYTITCLSDVITIFLNRESEKI